MSMYAPVPVASFCNSGSFTHCRIYDSFINRRYFMVAKSSSGWISSWTIAGTSGFAPTLDADSNYYDTLLYVT